MNGPLVDLVESLTPVLDDTVVGRLLVMAGTQRVDGLLGGSFEPPGFVFSVAGGAVSGSIAILGSTLGGLIAERGSGIVLGRRSIPGSIREGGGVLNP